MMLVIFDGNCNLCVTLVRLLESLDRGDRFRYLPMQDERVLSRFGITPQGCELGMILLNPDNPQERWQGTAAAEEIGRRLPAGEVFVQAYRKLPGLKNLGDGVYEQVRDNRYDWFGRRDRTYGSQYPPDLTADASE
ncbi:DCC1-like thiol-disulfide oxidoreductase family protein [Phormidium yuhuli AB48]|uniref:DCC1-like thiol-disulfide oxidoreductase family protein n=1 Tax=Phormidium yuhuli AB48 TaxID=2940671 RepID=A0ABY5AKD4_9CYAN|nr:DCC1-like thiol-disulfide oxidoreductase family protein [Phormidium yuhuli]USR89317.1 DCC1-like thiol-disulfide oxidoreductase family protein [Phormidium yuhuli AB48]